MRLRATEQSSYLMNVKSIFLIQNMQPFSSLQFEPTYEPTFEPTFEPAYKPAFEPAYEPEFEPLMCNTLDDLQLDESDLGVMTDTELSCDLMETTDINILSIEMEKEKLVCCHTFFLFLFLYVQFQ